MGTEEPGEEPVQTGVLPLPCAECGASVALLQDRISVSSPGRPWALVSPHLTVDVSVIPLKHGNRFLLYFFLQYY